MKKNLILITLIAIFMGIGNVSAQDQGITPNYDLAERFSPKKLSRMVHSTSVRPNWFKNSDKFWYTWQTPEGILYYIVDPVAKTKRTIWDMGKLAREISEIIKDPFDAQHLPIRDLKLVDDRYFTFEIESSLMVEPKDKKKSDSEGETPAARRPAPKKEKKVFRFEYDIQSNKLKDITEDEKETDFPRWASISPDTNYVVYVKGLDLYYTDMANMRKLMEDEKDSTVVEHRLTFDGTKDLSYGGSSYRGTEERDSTKRYSPGIVWSPDSKHFIHTKYDMSKIKDLWVINSLSNPRPTLESYKYQMPGEPGPKTYLQLFNMTTKDSKIILTDAFKDQEISINTAPVTNKARYEKIYRPVWMGDNSKFYITRKSRDLKRIDICTVNVNEDSCKVVIEERLNTYIELKTLQLISNGKELIHWSERNGWAHLYLYGSDGSLKNAITDGEYHVANIVAVDDVRRVVYFTANGYDKAENPYYAHLYRVNFDGSGLKVLNPGDFDSRVSMTDDARFFVANAGRVDMAPENYLYDNNGVKVMNLEKTDISQLLMIGYKYPERFVVKAADGITDLHGVMYKPFDFDPTKTYPIIDYVYPGPQTEGNNIFWSTGMNRIDRLAQIGFIVITVGNRGGHPDRSKWYHNFGYGNLRDYGLEDQKVAIQQLAGKHSFIDGNKVGIHGHSGGGFMSTAAILTYPDFFKVAVSCAGNHDNSIYNRWWSETHHGVLEEVSEKGDTTFKYNIANNQSLARNLKGRLMLVTGDMDNNVHPAGTLRVVDALIKANKRFDLLVLTGQRHSFGPMDEYFFWRMADYFSENLLGTYQNSVDIAQINNN